MGVVSLKRAVIEQGFSISFLLLRIQDWVVEQTRVLIVYLGRRVFMVGWSWAFAVEPGGMAQDQATYSTHSVPWFLRGRVQILAQESPDIEEFMQPKHHSYYHT